MWNQAGPNRWLLPRITGQHSRRQMLQLVDGKFVEAHGGTMHIYVPPATIDPDRPLDGAVFERTVEESAELDALPDGQVWAAMVRERERPGPPPGTGGGRP